MRWTRARMSIEGKKEHKAALLFAQILKNIRKSLAQAWCLSAMGDPGSMCLGPVCPGSGIHGEFDIKFHHRVIGVFHDLTCSGDKGIFGTLFDFE